MPTYRHVVAVGVGVAIALSSVKSDTSQEIPSPTQTRRNSPGSENQKPPVEPSQEQLAAFFITEEEEVQGASLSGEAGAAGGDVFPIPRENSSPASSRLLVSVPATSPVAKSSATPASPAVEASPAPEEPKAGAKLDAEDVLTRERSEAGNFALSALPRLPLLASSSTASPPFPLLASPSTTSPSLPAFTFLRPINPDSTDTNRLVLGARIGSSVNDDPNPRVVNPIGELVKPARENERNSVSVPGETVLLAAALAPQTPENVSQSAKEVVGQPVLSLDGERGVGNRSNRWIGESPGFLSGAADTTLLTSLPRRYGSDAPNVALSEASRRLYASSDAPNVATASGTGAADAPGVATASLSPSPRVTLTPSSPGIQSLPAYPPTRLSPPPLQGISVVQASRPVRGVSAPEFLNPSPNPLQFPTQSEEVQIRTSQPITLEQALELAGRNNRTLEQARITLERNRASLQEALGTEFPTAGVNANFSRSEGSGPDQRTGALVFGRRADFNGGLRLDYDLYTAGRRPAQIRQAEQQVRSQQLEVERISEQLRLEVTNTYYDLQESDAQVEINRAAVIDAQQSLRDAQLLEQAGLGTRFDVLQAQVALASANLDLTRAISQQQINRRRIVQLLSLSQGVDVTAADPIRVAGQWPISLEQTIVLAFKNRAELEQRLIQRDIGEQQRRIALSSIRPQASLNASYNIGGQLNDEVDPGDDFRLGATLQWNFFDGGQARARAEQARRDIAISETTFADQRNQIRLEVEQAFSQLNANAANIETATFAVRQAEESLRLARLRFQAGVGTQTNVIEQQTELTRARGRQLSAILDYNRALAQLQRSTSNLPASNLFEVR